MIPIVFDISFFNYTNSFLFNDFSSNFFWNVSKSVETGKIITLTDIVDPGPGQGEIMGTLMVEIPFMGIHL